MLTPMADTIWQRVTLSGSLVSGVMRRLDAVTVRGDKAIPLLLSGLKVKEYELLGRNFSNTGCFVFWYTRTH